MSYWKVEGKRLSHRLDSRKPRSDKNDNASSVRFIRSINVDRDKFCSRTCFKNSGGQQTKIIDYEDNVLRKNSRQVSRSLSFNRWNAPYPLGSIRYVTARFDTVQCSFFDQPK